MRSQRHYYLLAFACGFVLALLPSGGARADEIVAVVDAHGHKVYINTGEPPTHVDWAARGFNPRLTGPSKLPPQEVDRLVQQTATRFQVDPHLVHAIIQVESEYDPNAVSRKGAMGLMQLVPATAQRFGVENPFDPQQNIEGGVNYLRYLLKVFGGNLALSLAAYNAGEQWVLRTGRIPPFIETRDYVHKVTNLYKEGWSPTAPKPQAPEPEKAHIIRYVDAQGVVHYTNVD